MRHEEAKDKRGFTVYREATRFDSVRIHEILQQKVYEVSVRREGLRQMVVRTESAVSGGTFRAALAVLGRLWEGWKRIVHVVGNFQARVILTLFYFVLLGLVAIPVRLLSDPLRHRLSQSSFWLSRRNEPVTLEEARRQF